MLDPAERHTILREWNDTARPLPRATLPELFAAQAQRTPDAIAVVFGDEWLSYAELDARANQLAHHLRGLGVGPEVVVGLCVERSPAMLVGLLGILKAGGAYLPLDPGYPQERLAFMLEDAGRAGAGDAGRAARTPARAPWIDRAARCRLEHDRREAHHGPAPRPASRQHRLRHLHLGIDRVAKGVAVAHRERRPA